MSPSAFAIAIKSNEGCCDNTKAKADSAPARSWLWTNSRTFLAFLKFTIKAKNDGGIQLRGNMVFQIIFRHAWHLSKNRCTCCTRSWNFATAAAFDLSVQKTSLNCERLVKASTRSCTRLFSSDKFRGMTGKGNDAKIRRISTVIKGNKGVPDTYSSSFM